MAKTTKKPSVKRSPARVASKVVVRMFCVGLGDCFLLSFPQHSGRPYSVLIDCGVAMGTFAQDENMKTVARTIAKLTAGVIDLLVVTHEHLDHVSGFAQAAQEFDALEIRNVWLAWTENRRDKLAQELKQTYGKAKLTLARVRAQLASKPSDANLRGNLAALDGVLAFHGLDGATLGAAAKVSTVQAAMENLQRWGDALPTKEHRKYLKPGDSLPLPGAAPTGLAAKVQAYALGPPHNREMITRINPSKKEPETYEKDKQAAASAGVNWSWSAAVLGATHDAHAATARETVDFDRSQPFDNQWRIPFQSASKWNDGNGSQFFQKHYFSRESDHAGRTIDDDWLLSGARRLALHLESYTNNTSLVLAFELPESEQVLLFAADAQVGNWLSWHNQTYTSSQGATRTAEQLLANTVLYKVGHHGSHNATLRELGLELMTHPELTALLPVDEASVKRLGYGEMPLQSLMKELQERCAGRIVKLDESPHNGELSGQWKGLLRAKPSREQIVIDKAGHQRQLYWECSIKT